MQLSTDQIKRRRQDGLTRQDEVLKKAPMAHPISGGSRGYAIPWRADMIAANNAGNPVRASAASIYRWTNHFV